MNEKTLKALRASERKWRAIARGTASSEGIDNCPLCKLFYYENCVRCPVMENTGRPFCEGTPYDAFESPTGVEYSGSKAYAVGEIAKKIALAEANYLRALIPVKTK